MKYLLKRITSAALAVVLLLTSMSTAVFTALAASYYINFEAEDKVITTIVERGSINASALIPPGYEFKPEQPFRISRGAVESQEHLFDISSTSKTYYTIKAKPGAVTGNSGVETPNVSTVTTYTLQPNLLAHLNDGIGYATIKNPDIANDDGTITRVPDSIISMKVSKSGTAFPISLNSELKLLVESGENAGTPTFKLTSFKGYFENIVGADTTVSSTMTTAGNSRTLKLSFFGSKGNFDLDIEMTLSNGQKITTDSELTISYNLQEINALTLIVATPQYAADTVSNGLANNPTNPQVTDKFKTPYVKLEGSDQLTNITKNFSVLNTIAIFNDNVEKPHIDIEWKWESTTKNPDGTDKYADVVDVRNGVRTSPVYVLPRKEDVRGHLIARPKYTLDASYTIPGGETIRFVQGEEVRIPITILGSGTEPSFVALTQTVGGVEIPILGGKPPTVMDVYNKPGDATQSPTRFTGNVLFGEGRGRAEKMTVTASGMTPDAIALYMNNSSVAYPFGTEMVNTDVTAGQMPIAFEAKKGGQVTLTFDFWVYDFSNNLVKSDKPIKMTFLVKDSTPRDFAEFSEINIISPQLEALGNTNSQIAAEYPRGNIDFGFKASQFLYEGVELPSKATSIVVTPRIPGNKGVSALVQYEISGDPFGPPTDNTYSPMSGTLDLSGAAGTVSTITIPMYQESPRTITLIATAENGRQQQYSIKINQMPPSTDSSLKSLTVTDAKGQEYLTAFLPGQIGYNIEVPYATRWVKVAATANNAFAEVILDDPPLIAHPTEFGTNWLRLTYPGDPQGGLFAGNATTVLRVKGQAEDKAQTGSTYSFRTIYTVNIKRADPDTNNLAGDVTFKSQRGEDIAFEDGATFAKDAKTYRMRIPYSNEKLVVEVKPDSLKAQEVKLQLAGGVELVLPYDGSTSPVRFELDVPVANATEKKFSIVVWVKSEKGEYTPVPYTFNLTRNDPDTDNMLASLTLTDQNDAAIGAFSFNPQTPDYDITVPFKVDTVTVTPTPRSSLAYAMVNGVRMDTYTKAYTAQLKPGEQKSFKVEVYPEDRAAEPRVYNIVVTRALASTDARLRSLVVDGGEGFAPLFDPNKTSYSVEIPEGTPSVTFTGVPADVAATFSVNGEAATSGQPSAAYEPLDANSTVLVVVTAEDGKTTMTYTVKVVNRNLIPKSTNADLKSLAVNYGDMSPRFKSAVTNYDVAVKDSVASVDILPVPQSDGATVKVYLGTRLLGDYNDNYSAALVDGENDFRVDVTAEDGTAKSYSVIVYRNDEEKQGVYRPITDDMVDYEQAGTEILVDISHYAVVDASVFNTLRDEYPDKTIVFQGNDYSLRIKGKDLKQLVPHEQTFDLSVTFTSPTEDDIWDIIFEDSRNTKIEPVFIHFNHHGALPGPMLFTMSLGRQYRNQNATWNYYNEERSRIDFYGGVKTNSRGTFSVNLTHMSTYLYSNDRIVGAENKSGESTGNITGDTNKQNPNTGF